VILLVKREKKYGVHETVSFKVVDNSGFPRHFFGYVLDDIYKEYKNFETESMVNPDFTIYIGDFIPSNDNTTIVDNKYFIKYDYFYCTDTYKSAKWKLEMSGFEDGDMKVKIYSENIYTNMVISGLLVDPLINFKLTEKGLSLVHASCISKDGNGFMFTAQGGGGKTSIALYSVERGFNFLGDNFAIIDKGFVRSFLSPLNVFSFNLAPIVMENMSHKSKAEYLFKDLLHKVTGLRVVTKINVKEIFPKSLVASSKLNSVFLLIPKERFRVEEIDKEEMVGHMVANMKLDSFPFLKYMLEYAYMFPESHLATHWNRYEDSLRQNLCNNIATYRVEVPQNYNTYALEKILELIR
jgi:hypothetical protein